MTQQQDQFAGFRSEWTEWVQQRRAGVTGPVGNLALVAFQPVGSEAIDIPGLPCSASRSADDAGVWVDPRQGRLEIARSDPRSWEPVAGRTFVPRLTAAGVPLLRAGDRTADVFSLDGSDYEIRIYDAKAPKLGAFEEIEVYGYDPAWRVPARLESYDETEQVPWEFTRTTDTGHTKTVPGSITAEIAGDRYQFTAFADGDHLVLVFADETSGRESYAPGRFLRFAPPAEGESSLILDFNYAFIPPCGFSDFYSCPIPPAQNRIAAPVRAGERKVLWKQ